MVSKLTCRACLQQKLALNCESMSPEEENEKACGILEMLSYCVPELDINLVVNPVICRDCLEDLKIAYKFKTECLKNEEKLLKYSHSNNTKVDLKYFRKNIHLSIQKKHTLDKEPQNIQVIEVEQQDAEQADNSKGENVNKIKITNRPKFDSQKCYGCINKLKDPSYHIKNYISPFICHNCSKQFDDIQDLRKHMMNHRRQRKCKVCNKCFRDLHHLTTHLRTHTGSKPFSCAICPKSFREKYKLDQHVKQHNGDNTVTCNICRKVLSTTYNLKVHMKQHVKKSRCELCGATFTSKRDLIKHLETDSETCGRSIKPKRAKAKTKVEIPSEHIKQELIKIEPEYVLDTSELLEVCKKENEDVEVDEVDVMN